MLLLAACAPATRSVPTPISTATVSCVDSMFSSDITIPDNTLVKPGARINKIWRMKNTGTCTWGKGFRFAFKYGSKMGGGDVTIMQSKDLVTAGATKDFGVELTAPTVPNMYTGCWRMQSDQGYWFGQTACVTIKVTK